MKISVFVKPNSKKGDLVEVAPDGLIVFLQAKAVDGAANQALIKVLAKHFSVAKSCVTIVTGRKSRQKNYRSRAGVEAIKKEIFIQASHNNELI